MVSILSPGIKTSQLELDFYCTHLMQTLSAFKFSFTGFLGFQLCFCYFCWSSGGGLLVVWQIWVFLSFLLHQFIIFLYLILYKKIVEDKDIFYKATITVKPYLHFQFKLKIIHRVIISVNFILFTQERIKPETWLSYTEDIFLTLEKSLL